MIREKPWSWGGKDVIVLSGPPASLLEENEQLPLFMLVCDLVVDDLARCWNLHDADPLGLGYV